jgi:hypothetical protein
VAAAPRWSSFQPGTDIGTALAQVQSGANAAYGSMPAGIAPPQVVQYSATDLPLLQVGVSSATVPETEVGELTNDVVRNTLHEEGRGADRPLRRPQPPDLGGHRHPRPAGPRHHPADVTTPSATRP